ncbi:sigma 54-interacting transcriptional regulator [uncultured Desulfosarcina sp.]|uniref:sigma-54 interaction domain-containing protein n=1 Tax=uncultured Desulfosarcina sp. TaxID=218289 RepID=UPI0029C92B85|nr:sigma 54-interacting transcriptional regulator [uncultured Desulfosarcina sp.]
MNSHFDQNRYSIQSFCDIVQPVIGAEVVVIDQDLIAVAGTGPFKKNIGSRRPRDSYVDLTLKSGESFVIGSAGETEQCLRCEMKSVCPYTSVLSGPIEYQNQVVGLFGILGYDKDQQKLIQRKSLFLSKIAKNIGDYIAKSFFDKNFSYYDFVTSQAMENIVNAIDQGVIITDCENNIIKVNQFAEEALKFKKDEYTGKDIGMVGDAVELAGSRPTSDGKASTRKSKFMAKATPIRHNDHPVGNVLLLQNNVRPQPCPTIYNFGQKPTSPRLIGASGPMRKLKDLLTKVAANDSKILICGETGTGKELVAQRIHYNSPRALGPFVALNCGAVPETLIESELFGYVKGAFTDARKNGKTGKFELANGGTIFLDEIGNLPRTGQAKLLRILDNDILEKIGSESPIELDVRVICATNKNLPEMVENGHFMEDLYYRLNVVQVEVPPLRERKKDISLLLDFYTKEYNKRFGVNLSGFTSNALNYLLFYQWPGNVRELKNVVEYVCNLKTSGFADLKDLPPYMSPITPKAETSDPEPINTEKLLIEEALRLFGNSTAGKQKAAKYLGISVSTLYRRLNIG